MSNRSWQNETAKQFDDIDNPEWNRLHPAGSRRLRGELQPHNNYPNRHNHQPKSMRSFPFTTNPYKIFTTTTVTGTLDTGLCRWRPPTIENVESSKHQEEWVSMCVVVVDIYVHLHYKECHEQNFNYLPSPIRFTSQETKVRNGQPLKCSSIS